MRRWERIILHHSASAWGTARDVDAWHKERGWSGIGYHFVVLNGYMTYEDLVANRQLVSLMGSIECGRPLDLDEWVEGNEVGAHALGFNRDSIGICLIHEKGQYPALMMAQVSLLVRELMRTFSIPVENVLGHYEVDDRKPACPSIDMRLFRRTELS